MIRFKDLGLWVLGNWLDKSGRCLLILNVGVSNVTSRRETIMTRTTMKYQIRKILRYFRG